MDSFYVEAFGPHYLSGYTACCFLYASDSLLFKPTQEESQAIVGNLSRHNLRSYVKMFLGCDSGGQLSAPTSKRPDKC